MKNKLKPILDESKNGFPDPIQVQCFKCSKEFWIRFVIPSRDYSKKNNWGYYTGKAEDKDKYKCNACLHHLYYDKPIFWKTITDLKSRKSYLVMWAVD